MQPDEQQTSLKPHAKVIAVGIICVALVATTFVYAQKNTLFGSSTGQTGANGTDVASTSSEENSVNPLASLQVQNATGTVTIVSPDILTPVGSSGATSSDDTLTARVSQDLFARLIADQQSGTTIDDTEANNIANEAIMDNAPTSQAKQYGISDIKITNDISQISKQTYANAINKAISGDASPASTEVITTMNNIMAIETSSTSDGTTPDTADVAQLNLAVNAYQKLITDTLKIPVPEDMVGYHITYLNALSAVLYDIQDMSQVISDPMTAYVGLADYQRATIFLQVSFANLYTSLGQ